MTCMVLVSRWSCASLAPLAWCRRGSGSRGPPARGLPSRGPPARGAATLKEEVILYSLLLAPPLLLLTVEVYSTSDLKRSCSANKCNFFDPACIHDQQFARNCCNSAVQNTQLFQQRSHECLVDQLRSLPENCSRLSVDAVVKNATDVNAIRAQTERSLWHQ